MQYRVEGDRSYAITRDVTVSIVVPTFNRRWQLAAALRSVFEQTFQDFEVIVVDDASTDGTQSFLDSIGDGRVRVLSHPVNRGAAAARNTGIAKARGKYIALLDTDDAWLSDKLEKQLGFLRANPDFRACCTGFAHQLPGNRQVERLPPEKITEESLYLGCRCAPGSTLLAETSLFREAGLFDEELRRLEDWEWLLRSARLTEIGVVQEALTIVRASPSRRGLYPAVKHACDRLDEKWCAAKELGRAPRRLLRGTLRNELAAVAYSEGKVATAVGQIALSLAHVPNRGPEFFQRIGYRVYCDLRHVALHVTERLGFGASVAAPVERPKQQQPT